MLPLSCVINVYESRRGRSRYDIINRQCFLLETNLILFNSYVCRTISADMILQCVKAATKNNSHVILEGILNMLNYSDMFHDVLSHYSDCAVFFYYLDVGIEETKVRHKGRAKIADFGCEKLDKWFSSAQQSGFDNEVVIPASSSVSDTVKILSERFTWE